ncbi:50S ribosomal protein L25 [Bellilinea sp.]|jgi:large subunit ribosomal protein L25|uniref:50S ribosomal protein L25 n=1 Tax=Bellilinea sp. TaxID=2838785 RepID=UPI002ADDEFE4|nr:50S ribosomal protein L25 [Bellilinea sp.]
MEKLVIQATRRSVTGKKVGALRRDGKLPGILYGYQIDSTPILMELREASRVLAHASSSQLITINLDGKEFATLVREKQRDFIKGTLLHVDFQVVSLTEKIRTSVGIELSGTSPAVKDFNGVIVQELDEVEVEALPQDLPDKFVVDISGLTKIGDAVFVRDLNVPSSIEILNEPDEVVVIVTGAAPEISEEEVSEEISEPEVIERGKKEEEEIED